MKQAAISLNNPYASLLQPQLAAHDYADLANLGITGVLKLDINTYKGYTRKFVQGGKWNQQQLNIIAESFIGSLLESTEASLSVVKMLNDTQHGHKYLAIKGKLFQVPNEALAPVQNADQPMRTCS